MPFCTPFVKNFDQFFWLRYEILALTGLSGFRIIRERIDRDIVPELRKMSSKRNGFPMSDDNTIDQNDVEKLLAANSETNQPPVEPAATGDSLDAPQDSDVGTPEIPTNPEPPKVDDGNKTLGQSDIETLLKGTIGAPGTSPKTGAGIGMTQGGEGETVDDGVPQGDIDYLLRRAEEALESITSDAGGLTNGPPEVLEFQFPEFGGSTPNTEHATLDQISEVELDIKIELGRTNMYLEDILKLRKGSVVALDKIAGDAVDIYVNDRLIARGEVLVLNDNFCVRVAELLAGAIPIE